MFILQTEHSVPSYEGWKEAFDSDPIHRKESGVRWHRIYRPSNDSKYVIVDLGFDDLRKAELTLLSLQEMWGNVTGRIMVDPKARIMEVVEEKEY